MRLAISFPRLAQQIDIYSDGYEIKTSLVIDTGRCRIGAFGSSILRCPLLKVGEGVEVD